MNLTELEHVIGLSDTDRSWYRRWEEVGPPSPALVLPPATEISQLLVDRLGVDQADAEEIAAARPTPETDPQLWWVLERCHRQLREGMGGTDLLVWPALSRELGAKGRFLYVWALLSVLPDTLAYHRSRGVPEEITWATLANIGEKLRVNRLRHGEPGLAVAFWFTAHFRGALYRLGRLEFCMERLSADHPFEGHAAGELTLGVHIPAEGGGPFTPEACRESVEAALRFFPEHFGDRFTTRPTFTCTSWLLDPKLGERMPAGANITAFQNRFRLTPAGPEADVQGRNAVLLFAFNHVGPFEVDELPTGTTLHRVLAEGFRDGGWQVRSGVMDV